jgi:hypothetical protein
VKIQYAAILTFIAAPAPRSKVAHEPPRRVVEDNF